MLRLLRFKPASHLFAFSKLTRWKSGLDWTTEMKLKDHLNTLGVKEPISKVSLSIVKRHYLGLCKQYHPDSVINSSSKSDAADKLQKVQEAYRFVTNLIQTQHGFTGGSDSSLQNLENEQEDDFSPEDFSDDDVKFSTLNHRKFLNDNELGGTVFERHKMSQKRRADAAVSDALSYKLNQAHAEEAKEERDVSVSSPRKQKIKSSIDGLADEQIRQAMERGEFDNLPGSGKPLKDRLSTFYAGDATEFHMNRIAKNEGYTLEWASLEKDILQQHEQLKKKIMKCHHNDRGIRIDLSTYDKNVLLEDIAKINKLIDEFNLRVPILNSQKVHVKLDRELRRLGLSDASSS